MEEHWSLNKRSWVQSRLGVPCCVLEQDALTPQEYWLIPKRWPLYPDMSERLLAGTLNLITNKQANKNMLLISIKNTVVSRISIHKQMLYILYLFQ